MKILLALVPLVFGVLVLSMLCDFDFGTVWQTLKLLQPFDWHEIGIAIYCGSIVGWERMMRNKALGIRTSIFIVLGTYVFTAVSMFVSAENDVADATRVIGQIVSGIGFLGAGVMIARNDKVTGLTSAATIWVLAAMGVCIGLGYLTAATILVTLGVTLLIVINEIDEYIVALSKSLAASYRPKYKISRTSGIPGYLPDAYTVRRKDTRFGLYKAIHNPPFTSLDEAEEFLNAFRAKAINAV